ncbi:MBL fold metallo-hydrolase [Candidatus Clostridium radicumherbarum]|uniref:MBL fold metallo-hydrolase n=1 Tax=Candidatus Clostridium radicumherbarum TaxID=3381662 RepID=A0ABW8TMK8_9CLOT
MKLTVLGNYGPFPGKDGACLGYLLQDEDTNILIDCGNGVLSRLQKYCRIEDLDAIILSHLHRDHSSDMHVLKYAVQNKLKFKTMDKAIEVYTPKTPDNEYNDINIQGIFNTHIIEENMTHKIKSIKIEFYKTIHPVECYGMRIEKEGKIFAYSADSVYCDNIISLAKKADLFLCDAYATENIKSKGQVPHLSVKEACNIAVEAKAKKLLLTHFWFEEPKESYINDSKGLFNNIALAEEYTEYEI